MSWLLARTIPQRELRSSQVLTRFNYPNHVFKHQILQPHRGKMISRLTPAFPSYVFLEVVDEARMMLETIWHYACLVDFVRTSGIASLADNALDHLKRIALPGDVLPHDSEMGSRFKFGDKVQVVAGPQVAYDGCVGIYQLTVKPGRVSVLFPWLGRLVSSELNECDIELVSEMRHRRQRKKGGRRHRYRHGKVSDRSRHFRIEASAQR